MIHVFVCVGTDSNNSPTQPCSRTPMDTHLPVHESDLESVESPATEMAASSLDWDANVAPTLEPVTEANINTWAKGRATLVPGHPDFLMSYATLPGQLAYHDPNVGSLYVGQLALCLRQHLEIDRALKKVSSGVAEELKKYEFEDNQSQFQLPFHLTSGMDKLITL